jgi:hypothetical protein
MDDVTVRHPIDFIVVISLKQYDKLVHQSPPVQSTHRTRFLRTSYVFMTKKIVLLLFLLLLLPE